MVVLRAEFLVDSLTDYIEVYNIKHESISTQCLIKQIVVECVYDKKTKIATVIYICIEAGTTNKTEARMLTKSKNVSFLLLDFNEAPNSEIWIKESVWWRVDIIVRSCLPRAPQYSSPIGDFLAIQRST